jgi:hypothetical protein
VDVSSGEVVLFRINENPEILRPLLVVSVVDGDTISGEVFLDYERDRQYDWPRKLFYALHKDSRFQWVSGVLAGSAVGTWRERESEEVSPERAPKQRRGGYRVPLRRA